MLVEEMRRVLWFMKWKQKWWRDLAGLRTDVRPDIREGLSAYAAKQSAILSKMAKHAADKWHPILAATGIVAEWPEEHLTGRFTFVSPTPYPEPVQDDEDLEIEDDMFD